MKNNEHLCQHDARNSTKLLEEWKMILTEEDNPYFQQAEQKKADGELLPGWVLRLIFYAVCVILYQFNLDPSNLYH